MAVRLANAYCVALSDRDPQYRRILVGEGVTLPDGTPVALLVKSAARRRGHEAERVRGPSFFAASLSRSAAEGTSVFLLGSTPAVLGSLAEELRRRHPALRVAGSYSPPFAPVDAGFVDDCARQVEAAGPDFVWIGLGTPKQDELSAQLASLVSRPCVGVGAAFDFMAGTVREAPSWMQRIGAEWLFRFASEPKRLWRRYTWGNLRFAKAVVWPSRRSGTEGSQ